MPPMPQVLQGAQPLGRLGVEHGLSTRAAGQGRWPTCLGACSGQEDGEPGDVGGPWVQGGELFRDCPSCWLWSYLPLLARGHPPEGHCLSL